MKLYQVIETLKFSGIKVIPVPGTSNYTVTLPNGQVTRVKENQLIQLVSEVKNSNADFQAAFQQLSM